jgi:hypothetical protein
MSVILNGDPGCGVVSIFNVESRRVVLTLLRVGGQVLPARHVAARAGARDDQEGGRQGLTSFTSQLNFSVFYEIGGARKGYVARVKGVFGGV